MFFVYGGTTKQMAQRQTKTNNGKATKSQDALVPSGPSGSFSNPHFALNIS